MASDKQKRDELVKFLDDHAFDPIINKSDNDFPESKQNIFQDVKSRGDLGRSPIGAVD